MNRFFEVVHRELRIFGLNVAADEGEEKPSRIFVFVQQVTLKPEIYFTMENDLSFKFTLNSNYFISMRILFQTYDLGTLCTLELDASLLQ